MARSTLWKHRKFRALEAALGSRCLAAGVLECMWSVGYETGDDLLGMTAEEVGNACGFGGKGNSKKRFLSIMIETGWIDDTPEGYRIHDLFQHCPQYVKRRRERHLNSHKIANSYSKVSTPTTTPTTTTTPSPVSAHASTVENSEQLEPITPEKWRELTSSIGHPKQPDAPDEHRERVLSQAAAMKVAK